MFPRGALFALLLSSTVLAGEARPPASLRYVDLSLKWERGKITVEKIEPGRFDAPTVTRRFAGRFEARVTGAGKPLDAIRFDFPLLANADPGVMGPLDEQVKANAVTRTRVRVPLPDGADGLALIDLRDPKAQPLPVPLGDGK